MKKRKILLNFIAVCLAFLVTTSLIAKEPVTEKERINAGKELFVSKNCSFCHGIHGKGGTLGPDLEKWESVKSPVLWAAIMWNHVPGMVKAFKEKKIGYPYFEGDEIAYVFEYIHSRAKRMGGAIAFPGDEERGAFLFQYLGCRQCHTVNEKGGFLAGDLTKIADQVKSDNELAGRMISHAPYMSEKAEMQKLYWPRLQGNEIAHLFAYFKSLVK